jgi:predicted RNase H-like HicB family nuclease
VPDYIQAAMRYARCEAFAADRGIYCEIPPLPGVWSHAGTHVAALAELREVLEEWLAVGLALGHATPRIDGIRFQAAGSLKPEIA